MNVLMKKRSDIYICIYKYKKVGKQLLLQNKRFGNIWIDVV